MERRTIGWLALGIGGAMAVVGGAILYSSRREREMAGLLGRAVEKTSKDGMVLTHHRSRRMPIKERVGIIQDLTYKSVQDPSMRKLALKITKGCRARDGACEAKAIYDWVKRNIRYTGDVGPHKLGRNGPVEGVDLFMSAARVVEFGGGDCDDASILNCTLALHNGLACKFRVTSPSTKRSDDWTHIYAMVGLPKNRPTKWVAMDTTLPHGRFGTEAPYKKRRDFVA